MVEQQSTRRSDLVERVGYGLAWFGALAGTSLMLFPVPESNVIDTGREALEKFPDAIAYLLPPVLAVRAYEAWGVSPSVALETIIMLSSGVIAGVTYLRQRRRQSRAS